MLFRLPAPLALEIAEEPLDPPAILRAIEATLQIGAALCAFYRMPDPVDQGAFSGGVSNRLGSFSVGYSRTPKTPQSSSNDSQS